MRERIRNADWSDGQVSGYAKVRQVVGEEKTRQRNEVRRATGQS